MNSESRARSTASALLLSSLILIPTNTSAITVEVAKKCNALINKQFPPRQIGNPAAGSSKGTGKAQREFFNKCVTDGGKADGADQGASKP
jgi:hypothetical protein